MRRHNPDWGSHIPVLVKVLEITTGPVLELGIGISSTPLLHMLCHDQNRILVSYDHDRQYVNLFKLYKSNKHQIRVAEDWDKIDIYEHNWSVVLVDHGPDNRRAIEIKRLVNAEFLVIHDTEPENENLYGYESIYPLFKYRFDYTKAKTRTTVLSNLKEFKYE